MGIRPNKTNFGLSFGDFGEQKGEGERKKRRRGRREERYGFMTLSLDTCLDLLWFCLDFSLFHF